MTNENLLLITGAMVLGGYWFYLNQNTKTNSTKSPTNKPLWDADLEQQVIDLQTQLAYYENEELTSTLDNLINQINQLNNQI